MPEVALLVGAMHDVGVPTWQDIRDLEEVPTEDRLRTVIRDEHTAGAVLWLTPEVAESPIIRTVEVPEVVARAAADPEFLVFPVIAGGLTFTDVNDLFSGTPHADRLHEWNIVKVPDDESTAAVVTAHRVLARRLALLNRQRPADAPIELGLYTRSPAPSDAHFALTLDWFARLVPRPASVSTWDAYLLPAIHAVSDAIRVHSPRRVLAQGQASIPACVALGSAFLSVGGIELSWNQLTDERWSTWSLSEDRGDTSYSVAAVAGDATASDLAVLVSVSADVTAAVSASHLGLPRFRARVEARPPEGPTRDLTSADAERLARAIVARAREARTTYGATGVLHLFIAGPVGLAVLIARLLNTFGKIHTYEFIGDVGGGSYALAAVLSGTR